MKDNTNITIEDELAHEDGRIGEDVKVDAKMTDTERLQLFKQVRRTWGIHQQSDIAIEEMAELTKAIIKYRRARNSSSYANVVEEIADVQIMLDQLKIEFQGSMEIERSKLQRLKLRLEKHHECD